MNDFENDRNRPNGGGPPLQPIIVGDEKTIDLREIFVFLRDGKWIIAGITVLGIILAFLYVFFTTPIYEADALVQVQQQQGPGMTGNFGVLSALFPVAAPTQAEIDIMQSRAVLLPTVEKENLNIVIGNGKSVSGQRLGDPKLVIAKFTVPDQLMDQELTLVANGNEKYTLFSPHGKKLLTGHVGELTTVDSAAVQILVEHLDAPAGKHFSVQRIHNQEAVAALQENFVATEQGQNTGIVQLELQGADPNRIRNILNTITNQYIEQNVQATARRAHQGLVFVNKQLPQVKQQLDKAQTDLAHYQAKKGIISLDAQAQALLQTLTSQEAQLTQLNLTKSGMSQRFTGNYPGLEAIESQKQEVLDSINATNAKISQLPAKERDYINLQQKVQIYQQLYTTLLAKAQDLQISQASTTGSARVVDYAVTPLKPVKPKKALVVLLGVLIGLLVGLIVVFVRRSLTHSIDDAAELETEFGLPVYAVVPHSKRQEYLDKKTRRGRRRHRHQRSIPVLAIENPHDPAVESIRSLNTSISFALQEEEHKVITIGGCTMDVGKSFVSVNLAHVMGMNGARVLLLDADLRRGHLEKYMNTHKGPGLSELLRGDAELAKCIRPGKRHDNVDLISSGLFPPNPYELIASRQMESLIERVALDYDIVILDLPPVLAAAEGLVIAQLAVANFLVVEAGAQKQQEVRIVVDRMRQNGADLKGFVFNNLSRVAQSYTYGRYGEGYYYYSPATREKQRSPADVDAP